MKTFRPIIFINSHPIQYFAPLYRFLNAAAVETECWYCSGENLKGHVDRQFGVRVAWDIPILDGYKSRFFRNRSLRPSIYNGFFGLFNPGMVIALFRQPPSLIVVHGWAYLTHVLILLLAKLAGHRVCLRGETPLNQQHANSGMKQRMKRLLLGTCLFRFVDFFLYIGSQNKKFYQSFGVDQSRLIFTPYAVDNARFRSTRLTPDGKMELKKQLGFPADRKVILFSAKYIAKKRPLDLLKAFKLLGSDKFALVMVGDGELRADMESFITDGDLRHVYLTGFVNQADIPKYYAVADTFVMCSGVGETWGLSVNEAMNFDIPIVVSDTSGCATDLVIDGTNGYSFPTGDHTALAAAIERAAQLKNVDNTELIATYSFESIKKSLTSITNDTHGSGATVGYSY